MPAQPPLVAGRSGCGGPKDHPDSWAKGSALGPMWFPNYLWAQLRSFNKSVLGRIILVPK